MPAGPGTRIAASDGLWEWLASSNISLAFTTYQANKVFFVGRKPDGRLGIHMRQFDRPMGIAGDARRLVLATRYQVWELENRLAPGESYDDADALYVPSRSTTTGDLNTHDLALGARGHTYFINTAFSCVAQPKAGVSFDPVWTPPFITALRSEDRCHLNGLALRGGKPAYVTACSATDTAAGWRNHRIGGGIVMHIASNEIIASGLSMPHSPRWYRNKLWLLNAGTGEFGCLDGARFVAIASCPGFARGLAMSGDHAVIGMSKMRRNSFGDLPLERRLAGAGQPSQCGLLVVNLKTGKVEHTLSVDGDVEELFDVVVLPGMARPKALGFVDDDIQRIVNFPGSGGLTRTQPSVRPTSPASPAGQRARFQQVFHLTPDNLRHYQPLTDPALWLAWQAKPFEGELIAVSAAIDDQLVGLAVADGSSGTLLSLVVLPPFKQHGLEDALLAHLHRLAPAPSDVPPPPAPEPA